MIAVLHAFSEANLGDALLVDLTVDRLRVLGYGPEDLTIVSLDPSSFSNHGRVVGCGTPGRAVRAELVPAAARSLGTAVGALTGGRLGWSALRRELADATGFVAVGGGYLRAGSVTERVGVTLNHLPQLLTASRSSVPSYYLPQSIGPLSGAAGRIIRSELGKVDRVRLRDDTSVSELPLAGASYCPDLAILALAESGLTPGDPSREFALIARDLGSERPGYSARLIRLAERLGPGLVWATQTTGTTEKSDDSFYQSLGVRSSGRTDEVVESVSPAVVVSVRLHGSLMALAAGFPTIHLSYQRKGWSAMRDLGLADWVHDAGDFDPDVVADQAEALRADSSAYWRAIEAAVPDLRAMSADLTDDMAKIIGRASS